FSDNASFSPSRFVEPSSNPRFCGNLGHRRQKWFWGYLLPGINPESTVFLEPNILTSSTIAQIWLKKLIFPKFLANLFGNVRKILQKEMR
ncbi:MAG: hypothetical protein KKD99_09780, partial [Proteobacteria bacterium]|nr:hypothetical protein [Pseudomonadota bacterium]